MNGLSIARHSIRGTRPPGARTGSSRLQAKGVGTDSPARWLFRLPGALARAFLTSLAGLCLAALVADGAEAQPSDLIIENTGAGRPDQSFRFNLETGVAHWTNGVRVVYGDMRLTADSLELNEETGEILASGDVTIRRDGHVWRGERIRYNYRTEAMESDEFKAGAWPVFVSGKGLSTRPDGAYVATNAFVTTDNVADPAFKIRARALDYLPGEVVQGSHARFEVGDTPVLYFPYFRKRLDPNANNWEVVPGYRTAFGPYLLGTYNWRWTDSFSASMQMDYRLKRGFGGGPGVAYDAGRWGRGEASFYYLNDDEPEESALPGETIDPDRYRVAFAHKADVRPGLSVTATASKLSDPLVERDFFESAFRNDPQPKSFVEVHQSWPNFSLSALAQPQFNDFFQSVERLPDVKLTALRQRLGVSPFFYEGESSASYLRFEPGLAPRLEDYSAFRADTFHQLLLPRTFFGWLNVTPRAGGRLTYYGEADGPGAATDEESRAVFNTGVETSFKLSRVWLTPESRFWRIDGLRHIIEPSVNYSFVPSPSVSPKHLPQFDRVLPTYRLLPIHFPDYYAIDSIDSRNVLRLGLRNKLQTKRDDEIVNFVHWALFTDWRLDPRSGQDTFADVFSDADLEPWPWLTINSSLRYDVDDGRFDLADHSFTVAPNNVWSWQFGHRFFRGAPEFGANSGNNLFFSSWYYRINENWGVRTSHHFEARDGVLEEQYYTVYRDLRSWTAALTFRIRDRRAGSDDYTVAITFSLKAFPRFRLGRDRDDPSYLLGG